MINNFPNFVKPLADWHPVKTYFRENQILNKLLQGMSVVDINTDYQLFYNLFNQITQKVSSHLECPKFQRLLSIATKKQIKLESSKTLVPNICRYKI